MAYVYFDRREIIAKIVYFGAPGAGSNTNVRRLYGLVAAREKSAMHYFGPNEAQEQSCFFEYVPPGGGTVPGVTLRLRVYSLPGGVLHPAHRREVFEHLDGLVFVADARGSRTSGNDSAARELEAALAEIDRDPVRIPLVIQTNHGDAIDASGLSALGAWAGGAPTVRAIARSSVGVVETHDLIVSRLAEAIRSAWAGESDAVSLVSAARPTPEGAQEVVGRHLVAIRASASSPELPSAAEFELALEERYRALTPRKRHEVVFSPREVLGARPVCLLGATMDGERILIDLALERVSGSGPERVLLSLQPRAGEGSRTPSGTRATPPPAPLSIPDTSAASETIDRSAIAYGVIGALAGIAGGALLGFLAWG
jgi:hypothetical protein